MTPDNIAANMAAELADGWRALGVLELCFFGSRTADELRARCGIPCYDHHRHVQIRSMKLHYYPETDSLYIELSPRASVESKEVAAGLVADFDEDGNVVGFDIDRASTTLDLHTLEADSLPTSRVRVA